MSAYTGEFAEKLSEQRADISLELRNLGFELTTRLSGQLTVPRAKEFLLHGVCRRLQIIRRCIDNVFDVFPSDRSALLGMDERNDIEINLHAFVINVSGLHDNLAWVYVTEKAIEEAVGGPRGIGLFLKATQSHLPVELSTHMTSERMREWHSRYAKSYRDALAHRIPLYVPPAFFTPDDTVRFNRLEAEILAEIRRGNFDRADALRDEKNGLGTIAAAFVHSGTEQGGSRPLLLHPQIICDALAVLETVGIWRKYLP